MYSNFLCYVMRISSTSPIYIVFNLMHQRDTLSEYRCRRVWARSYESCFRSVCLHESGKRNNIKSEEINFLQLLSVSCKSKYIGKEMKSYWLGFLMLQCFRVKYNLTLNDIEFNAHKRESRHTPQRCQYHII